MILRFFFALVLCGMGALDAFAQTEPTPSSDAGELDAEYDRSSISIVYLKYQDDDWPNGFADKVDTDLSARYNLNALESHVITIPTERPKYRRKSILGDMWKAHNKPLRDSVEARYHEDILTALEEAEVGKQIMSTWSNAETLLKRAGDNTQDWELADGISHLKTSQFQPLLYKNFVLVILPQPDVETGHFVTYGNMFTRHTNRLTKDKDPNNYTMSFDSYFLRLKMDDTRFRQFVDAYDTPERIQQMDWTFEYVDERRVERVSKGETSQQAQQITELIKNRNGSSEASNAVSAISGSGYPGKMRDRAFKMVEGPGASTGTGTENGSGVDQQFSTRLRGPIVQGEPDDIHVNMGRREAIQADYRFAIYENVTKANGKPGVKRMGTARATNNIARNTKSDVKIEDNDDVRVTELRRIGPGKIYEGAIAVERRDRGVRAALGFEFRDQTNVFTLRTEYRISDLLSQLNPEGNSKFDPSGFHVFLSLAFDRRNEEGMMTGSGFGLGLSKTVYLHPMLDLEPYAGYFNGANNEGYLRLGVRAGVNLQHNIALVPEIGLSFEKNGERRTNVPLGLMARVVF